MSMFPPRPAPALPGGAPGVAPLGAPQGAPNRFALLKKRLAGGRPDPNEPDADDRTANVGSAAPMSNAAPFGLGR